MRSTIRGEILYGRDHDHVRIFVSPRMNGTLTAERKAAAEAIDSVSGHKAWWWEQDAPIGVLHSENECAEFAFHSDGLILLVAGELSDIVYAEYHAADHGGAERYILIRDGEDLPDAVTAFIKAQRPELVTRNFENIEELKSHVYDALTRTHVRALRHQVVRRREMREAPDATA